MGQCIKKKKKQGTDSGSDDFEITIHVKSYTLSHHETIVNLLEKITLVLFCDK